MVILVQRHLKGLSINIQTAKEYRKNLLIDQKLVNAL